MSGPFLPGALWPGGAGVFTERQQIFLGRGRRPFDPAFDDFFLPIFCLKSASAWMPLCMLPPPSGSGIFNVARLVLSASNDWSSSNATGYYAEFAQPALSVDRSGYSADAPK